MNSTTYYGVDIAKNVFQLHWVEPETGEVFNKQIKRAKFLEHFANRASCVIGMEACGLYVVFCGYCFPSRYLVMLVMPSLRDVAGRSGLIGRCFSLDMRR